MSRKFAVFDIDGTLYRHNTSYELFLELIRKGAIPQAALDEIEPFRKAWDEREHENAFYEHDQAHISAFTNQIAAGIDKQIYEATARSVAEHTAKRTYIYTRDLLRTLQAEGYVTIVLSMSVGALIRPLAELYNFDIAVCNEELYDEESGKFIGLSIRERGVGKGHLLQELVKEFDLDARDSYAIGDTASDVPILEFVSKPIAFNPDRVLQTIAVQRKWPMVIERKNSIYELIPQDNKYVLKNLHYE